MALHDVHAHTQRVGSTGFILFVFCNCSYHIGFTSLLNINLLITYCVLQCSQSIVSILKLVLFYMFIIRHDLLFLPGN